MLRKVLNICLIPYRVLLELVALAYGDELFCSSETDRKLIALNRRYPFFPNLWAPPLSEYQKKMAIFRFESALKCDLLPFLKDLAQRDALVDWLLNEEEIEVPPGWEVNIARQVLARRILSQKK